MECGGVKLLERDGEMFIRVGKEDVGEVMYVGEERYVSQMRLIIGLMERVKKLEGYLEKNLSYSY